VSPLQNPSVEPLRRSRDLGRVLAAWLLLWFAAMALPLAADISDAQDQLQLVAGSADCHGSEAADGGPHVDAHALPHAAHGEHGAGSVQHCPLCTHAAAPLLALLVPAGSAASRQEDSAPRKHAPRRVRTDDPPPARAPPAFS
jgi:hypothetical protein